mmetsp:Transcript_30110/g.70356  ORF Transcript_30110/g.70356 Transcript_30110/m.70356 type:complete len:223 (+) Transcript_30110:3410-4078(+)
MQAERTRGRTRRDPLDRARECQAGRGGGGRAVGCVRNRRDLGGGDGGGLACDNSAECADQPTHDGVGAARRGSTRSARSSSGRNSSRNSSSSSSDGFHTSNPDEQSLEQGEKFVRGRAVRECGGQHGAQRVDDGERAALLGPGGRDRSVGVGGSGEGQAAPRNARCAQLRHRAPRHRRHRLSPTNRTCSSSSFDRDHSREREHECGRLSSHGGRTGCEQQHA